MKELYQSGKTKEFILIGIGYPDGYDFDTIRERDLVRGPNKFLAMIVNGVIPYTESNYNIDAQNRTFCGASYGGFFMIYSLLQSDGLTKNVFLTVGEKESEYEFQLPIRDFVAKIQERRYSGLNLIYKVYEGKDHDTVWVPALLEGLEMYLE